MIPSAMTSRTPPTPPVYKNTQKSWQEILDYILRAGAQAPSWYNCQPWKFRVKKHQIDLILDETADESFYDWHNTNSLLACGAALENILIAADGRGVETQVIPFPEPSEPWLLARIRLNPEHSSSNSNLENEIWTRHTNTLMFENNELSKEKKDSLIHSISDFPDISLYLFSSDEAKQKVFNAVSCAEQVRFSRRDLHQQLHKMIRWNDAQALAEKTGYTLPSMGACGFGKLFFRLTRSWHIMRIMNFFGAYKDQAKRANLGLMNCSAVGLLTVKSKNESNKKLLNAGQALERLWLTATQLGLDLQAHNSLTQFHWAWRFGDSKIYSPTERKRLSEAFELYSQAFPDVKFKEGESGLFLFRVGRGLPVHGYTLRKTFQQLLEPAGKK